MKSEGYCKDFGYNLMVIRTGLGHTQAEFARLCGITPAAICQIEQGRREPSLKTILKIINVTSVKFEVLVYSRPDCEPKQAK